MTDVKVPSQAKMFKPMINQHVLQNRSQKNPTLAKLRVDFPMFLLHGPMATYATPPISASLNGSWHLAMWV
jgi:hypothetical protein